MSFASALGRAYSRRHDRALTLPKGFGLPRQRDGPQMDANAFVDAAADFWPQETTSSSGKDRLPMGRKQGSAFEAVL